MDIVGVFMGKYKVHEVRTGSEPPNSIEWCFIQGYLARKYIHKSIEDVRARVKDYGAGAWLNTEISCDVLMDFLTEGKHTLGKQFMAFWIINDEVIRLNRAPLERRVIPRRGIQRYCEDHNRTDKEEE
jgi:hypothetical protein